MLTFTQVSKKLREIHSDFDGMLNAVAPNSTQPSPVEIDVALIKQHWDRLCGKENAAPPTSADDVLNARQRTNRKQELKRGAPRPERCTLEPTCAVLPPCQPCAAPI